MILHGDVAGIISEVGEGVSKFKVGDEVSVTGSRVVSDGEQEMIAMTVTRGNEVLRLRDKDGNAQWVGWKKASD